jgi:hypothetical protein
MAQLVIKDPEPVRLGSAARCKVSGMTGIVTGHAKWLTGHDQFYLQPPVQSSGVWVDGRWIDVDQLQEDWSRPGLIGLTNTGHQ